MSSAEKVSYIQNQPLPDDVTMLKTGRAPTTNKGELKKTLSFQSSWMNHFAWLTFSKLLNGGLCFVSCSLSQMSNIKIHLLRNLLLRIRKSLGKPIALLKHQPSEHHTSAKSVYIVYL